MSLNIKDISALKLKTEHEISKLVSDKLNEFSVLTGLPVRGIDIRTYDVRTVDCKHGAVVSEARIKPMFPWEE